MLFACLTPRVLRQSVFLPLARDYLSSKPCTTSNLHTTFPSTLIIMSHNAGAFILIRVLFILFNHIAEAPERVEEVSLDSLHSMIKEQGAVFTFVETIVLTLELNYSSTDTKSRG
jgi:hypothetical protein